MSQQNSGQPSLLDSGTNEFEIIEFLISGQSFGINVSKVKQIVQFSPELLTSVPSANPNVMGIFLFRKAGITLVDLHKALSIPQEGQAESPLVLVTEFNGATTGFLIDGVNRIHKASWSLIQPINTFLENFVSSFTGSLNIESREILMIDLEHVIAEINPENNLVARLDKIVPAKPRSGVAPSEIKIALAEDSSFIRKGMVDGLEKAGFNVVAAFDNGLSAFEHMKGLQEKANAGGAPLKELLSLFITDIEMPKMNGITLCKSLREIGVKELPVVVFSSIINKQMTEKCEQAGVNAFISKPRMEDLNQTVLDLLEKGVIKL